MRILEIIVIFLLLLIMVVGMSIPVWWDYGSPYIFKIPQYISGIISNIKDFVEMISKSLEK